LLVINAKQETVMKPIQLIAAIAVFSLGVASATAKTVTSSHSNSDETSVIGVAGPAPAGNKPVAAKETSSAQPSKSLLKKSKIKTPPPMHDPN
jgi:hypothetical protein